MVFGMDASEEVAETSFLFPFRVFSDFESALELIFSLSAASVILYTAALKCGTNSCRRVKERVRTKEKALESLSKLKNEERWGKVSFQNVNFERGSGKLIIVKSFETITRKAKQPSCHFFRGFLAGFLSELFQKTIAVTEEKCVAKGDKRCEFIFEPSKGI